MSNHWWRAYDEAVDNPKLLLLSDKQHRAWFNLMGVTSANGGTLPEMKVVAVKLRTTEAKAIALVAELIEAKLFDHVEDGSIAPHNWKRRQYKSDVSTERVKRFRNNKRNVSETPPETENRNRGSEPRGSGANAPPIDPDADLFRRGKEILGPDAGSLIARLKKTKGGSIPHTRAAIEQASTKDNPREYVGRIISGADQSDNSFRGNPTGGSFF